MQIRLHVTNRLGKQRKKRSHAVSDIFFTMFFQSQLECGPNALGARRREFPRRDHFRDSNDVEFHEGYRKIPRERCKSRLTSEMSNATLFKYSERRKMTTFHFREFYFTSYVESEVSKCFSRQSRSDLPLRSFLYDASISSYRRSKFRTL